MVLSKALGPESFGRGNLQNVAQPGAVRPCAIDHPHPKALLAKVVEQAEVDQLARTFKELRDEIQQVVVRRQVHEVSN